MTDEGQYVMRREHDILLNNYRVLLRKKLEAERLIMHYGGIDGDHHKQWVLDQVLQELLGLKEYEAWVKAIQDEGYEWDKGIAP